MTEPPRSKVLRIGRRTKVHTSRSLRGGTTKRGTLSFMVRRAWAGGVTASAVAVARARTRERRRTLDMAPSWVRDIVVRKSRLSTTLGLRLRKVCTYGTRGTAG